MMHNVSNVVLCAEVTYKEYFVIQLQSKGQNTALGLGSLPALSQIYASFPSYSLFLNLSTLLCCIDLEISPWWRLRKGGVV